MLFIALMRARAGSTAKERLDRFARLKEQGTPGDVQIVALYVAMLNDFTVIAVFKADSYRPITALTAAFGDLFEITVAPAIPVEEGLELARQTLPG